MKHPKLYSQHGEDFILWSVFKDKKKGVFIDVGALDGVHFSNTYLFEKTGWTGLCIEAHPDYEAMLRKNRPNSICLSAAAGDQDKEGVDFYTTWMGSLSTLNKDYESVFKKRFRRYFTHFDKVVVPMTRLDTVIEKYSLYNIDFISIDVEGCELNVLKGIGKWISEPRIFIIESVKQFGDPKKVTEMLEKVGYRWTRKIGGNLIFCQREEDRRIVLQAKVPKFVSTIHPLRK